LGRILVPRKKIELSLEESDQLREEAARHIREDGNTGDTKTLWVPPGKTTLDNNHEKLMGEEGTCQLLGVPRIPKGDVDCVFRGWDMQIKCYDPRSTWHLWLLAKPVKRNKAGTTCHIITVCFYHLWRIVTLERWISRRRFYEIKKYTDRLFPNRLPIDIVKHTDCNKPSELFDIPWRGDHVVKQGSLFGEPTT
jgi:hypothetical protein